MSVPNTKITISGPWSVGAFVKLFLILLIIGGIITGIIFREVVSGQFGVSFLQQVGKFLGPAGTLSQFVERIGIWGPIVYALVYAVCTVLGLPGVVFLLSS